MTPLKSSAVMCTNHRFRFKNKYLSRHELLWTTKSWKYEPSPVPWRLENYKRNDGKPNITTKKKKIFLSWSVLGFFGGLIHHFWTFVHWHGCETMKCFGAFSCKMPRFASFFLVDCTIVREFICLVKTTLMVKHRTGFRVFSGSHGCQR